MGAYIKAITANATASAAAEFILIPVDGIPNANTTSAAAIRTAFYKAMAEAIQNPKSLPLLLENGTVVTSAAAGAAAL